MSVTYNRFSLCTTVSSTNKTDCHDIAEITLTLNFGDKQWWQYIEGEIYTGSYANLCMLCAACFLMFKHWFFWKYLHNNYIFHLIDIYIYIPANGCIGSRRGVLLCPGSYNAVKTALSRLAFPRFTKHIQNNVTQDSFLFN